MRRLVHARAWMSWKDMQLRRDEGYDLKKERQALAGVAQWIEHWPANQKVTSSIPSQGTCLGCGPGPQLGACKRQPIDVSLTH